VKVNKTTTRLADGRELIHYDSRDDVRRDAVDKRPLEPPVAANEIRHDPLRDEWVAIASHRQGRTYHPPADECPLCPSRDGRLSEIPAADYDVVVFENRFPSLAGPPGPSEAADPAGLFTHAPGTGRCEVVCFTDDHDASFADLTPQQAALVLHAWTDRTAELSRRPGVQQVFCFENRGREIGVTLSHSHGQIYAYPFTTPRTDSMLRSLAAHRDRTGGNLFDDLLAAERADGSRVVLETAHWTAFVPYAAHWPYEVHLHPRRRVPDLPALDDAARAEFPHVYLELLRRFDRLFGPGEPPTPYISAWHQAPVDHPLRGEFALHLELFTIRRTSGKLKYLAGSESGMDVFINDVPPESAALRLREVAAPMDTTGAAGSADGGVSGAGAVVDGGVTGAAGSASGGVSGAGAVAGGGVTGAVADAPADGGVVGAGAVAGGGVTGAVADAPADGGVVGVGAPAGAVDGARTAGANRAHSGTPHHGPR
jgi:UDPglucose--hexose-1-phosphate uridylyltransferase